MTTFGEAFGDVDTYTAARPGAAYLRRVLDRDDGPAIALYTGLGTREDVLHFDIAPSSPA